MAKLKSLNRSEETGTIKKPIDGGKLIKDHGLEGDAHSGSEIKQVSLLDMSEIEKMERETGMNLKPGEFAENLTSDGLNFEDVADIGTVIKIGEEAILEVSQIGKKCHDDCLIKEKTGYCIMPQKGIFFRVLKGGEIKPGDEITVEEQGES